MGEVEPSRHHVSILIGQLEGGLSWMKWSKNGAEESLYSMQLCPAIMSYTMSCLLKILLVKLKYLYIQHA